MKVALLEAKCKAKESFFIQMVKFSKANYQRINARKGSSNGQMKSWCSNQVVLGLNRM